ncbi:transporter substrate-binding domain-containing protein [Vibrio sp. DW001]|uniref:substrate-binding periplasmic protein n=1 Tax=Vibrio sp. DW001 TaxID=2912315 RepID=UPI0023B10383|nr:transporter substrate-binding domain-containing protein [Vibrio sp. DW001]WED25259.1 transporter substrate-binding domain-containing protein [Vibrio sp. DW001]
MYKHTRLYFLCFVFFFGTPVCAQEKLIFSAMTNIGAVVPVSLVLHQAYRQVKIDIEIKEIPGKRSLFYANSGETDGEVYRVEGIESKYPNLIRIDVPIRTEKMYLFVKKGNEFSVKNWEDFPENHTLGYIRGTYFIENAVSIYRIKIQPSSSYENLIRQLDANRNSVIIMGIKGERLIERLQLKDIVRLDPPFHTLELYHYLHKRHAHLVSKITYVLQQMKNSGEIEKINHDN